MIALIIIGALIAYIAIGCCAAFLFVWVDMIDPYDEEGAIAGVVCAWPILAPFGAAFYLIGKFTEYLQEVYDRKEK